MSASASHPAPTVYSERMDEHWSTNGLDDSEIRLRYQRLMSRAAGGAEDRHGNLVLTKPGEVLRELEAKLAEAADLGLLDSDNSGDRRRPN